MLKIGRTHEVALGNHSESTMTSSSIAHILDNMTIPSSPISLSLLFASLALLLLAILLYSFQSKLIYMPHFPPGSREQVWLPSRFGYGPGRRSFTKKEHDSDDETVTDDDHKWEEVVIETADKVNLQAYWIKAPSKWSADSEANRLKSKDSEYPYTVIYMQANAGNIVL